MSCNTSSLHILSGTSISFLLALFYARLHGLTTDSRQIIKSVVVKSVVHRYDKNHLPENSSGKSDGEFRNRIKKAADLVSSHPIYRHEDATSSTEKSFRTGNPLPNKANLASQMWSQPIPRLLDESVLGERYDDQLLQHRGKIYNKKNSLPVGNIGTDLSFSDAASQYLLPHSLASAHLTFIIF